MRILFVVKHSKYQWERITLGLSHEELLNKYSKESANLAAIMASHTIQEKAYKEFREVFSNADFCYLNEITTDIDNNDLVVSLGGDNSFTKVSHYIKNTALLGVNSDPKRSHGCLTRYSYVDFVSVQHLFNCLYGKKLFTEEWTRLGATLDDKKITPATSEYFAGETKRTMMSRHILKHGDFKQEQKCSGLLVATPAGCTGWYHSVTNKNTLSIRPFDKSSYYIPTEMFGSKETSTYLGQHEELIVQSLNDDQGCVSVDSWDVYPFPRGSELRISHGIPLKAVSNIG